MTHCAYNPHSRIQSTSPNELEMARHMNGVDYTQGDPEGVTPPGDLLPGRVTLSRSPFDRCDIEQILPQVSAMLALFHLTNESNTN
jgi:hypothetical protein